LTAIARDHIAGGRWQSSARVRLRVVPAEARRVRMNTPVHG